MNTDITRLGGGPACEPARFIVQVIGKFHRVAQKVVLRSANEESLWYFPDTLEKTWCSSTLHVWNDVLPGDRLCLEISSIEGEPIRLPLLDNLCWTPRQLDAQWNQLVPVLPFVPLPGSTSADDLGTPVLARAGFVYVFYQDRLWRELEIRIDNGQTTYHDVDLASYRQDKGFKPGERQPTGLPLRDIWLPVRWNNQPVLDLQLCYSEIQLSAARLQRLEQDRELRSQRCQRLQDSTCSNELFRDVYSRRPDGLAMLDSFIDNPGRDPLKIAARTQATVARRQLDLRCFPVSLVAPQRPREPGFEWQLEHPGRYLCDLAGEFPANAHDQAMSFLARCQDGTLQDFAASRHLELSAVADAMQTLLPAKDLPAEAPPAQEQNTDSLWAVQPAVEDVLTNARERQICGVLLDDSRYRLRHLRARLDAHSELLQRCAAQAMQHEHHASALLLHHLVVPASLHGQTNPLHASLKALDTQGRQAINRHMRVPERVRVWQHMHQTQERLTSCLQQTRTQQTLADHLSLEGFEYASALLVLSQTLATLAVPPSRLDPLAADGHLADAMTGLSPTYPVPSTTQQWLSKLANDSDMPLHRMLWPPSDPQRACEPYRQPEVPEHNPGDGLWLAHELAKLENATAPEPMTQTTLDAIVVANALAGGSLNSFLIGSGKNIGNALMSIHETLQGAVNAAQAAVDKARAQANTLTSQPKAARPSGAQPYTLNIKLHAQGIEQLRSMLPQTFGAVRFMPRKQVSNTWYLFGLEDLPKRSSMATRAYGEFLDHRGAPLTPIGGYKATASIPAPGSHLVLAIPRNHSTAQRLSDLNRRLSDAIDATDDARSASNRQTPGRSVLGDALHQHEQAANSRAYRLLNAYPFAIGVLMIEMWNVSAETKSREQNIREKGNLRALGGIWSAYIDLLIAMEVLTIKLTGTRSAKSSLPATRKVLFEISSEGATRWLGKTVADRFNRFITTRLLFQSASALLFAGLSFYDAWHAWRWNDDAMYGYLLMGTGGLLGFASLFIQFKPIMGLGPLGWATLLLTGTGLGLVLWLSDSPLEKWLAKGPFGPDNGGDIEHLQDPQEVFYRLISLLAGFAISIKPNPLYNPQAPISSDINVPLEVSRCNTVIRIESRLPGLLSSLGTMGVKTVCQLHELLETRNPFGLSDTSKRLLNGHAQPSAQRIFPNAEELYFDTPRNRKIDSRRSLGYEWKIRAQFSLPTPTKTHYFPAPSITDPLTYGPDHAEPDFSRTNQPFWADEQTYKAKL